MGLRANEEADCGALTGSTTWGGDSTIIAWSVALHGDGSKWRPSRLYGRGGGTQQRAGHKQ